MTGRFCDLCGIRTDNAQHAGTTLSLVRDDQWTWSKWLCKGCIGIILEAVRDTASKLNVDPVLPARLEPDEDSPHAAERGQAAFAAQKQPVPAVLTGPGGEFTQAWPPADDAPREGNPEGLPGYATVQP